MPAASVFRQSADLCFFDLIFIKKRKGCCVFDMEADRSPSMLTGMNKAG